MGPSLTFIILAFGIFCASVSICAVANAVRDVRIAKYTGQRPLREGESLTTVTYPVPPS